MKWTPILVFYLICAIAGLFIPWYFNLQQLLYSDQPFSIRQFIAEGMATPFSSSITMDFTITFVAAFVWMILESIRLKMKWIGFYVVVTFCIAFAFAFPLFLFFREKKLQLSNQLTTIS